MRNNLILGPRLESIINLAEGSNSIADIGCDHGKVAVTLAMNGVKVYAVDISNDSLDKAKKLAEKNNVSNNIEFYCSDGLDDVPHGIECIVISGMGERLISDIIEGNKDVALSAKHLILLPMDDTVYLRRYLMAEGLVIVDEELVLDEGRLYTTIKVEKGVPYSLSTNQVILGPKVIEKNIKLINELVQKQINKRIVKLNGLQKSKTLNKELENDIIAELECLRIIIEMGDENDIN